MTSTYDILLLVLLFSGVSFLSCSRIMAKKDVLLPENKRGKRVFLIVGVLLLMLGTMIPFALWMLN
tara:strand:- start:166 stop:363 length:198 start_codon:yes stop_codon:yes gene_type:complete